MKATMKLTALVLLANSSLAFAAGEQSSRMGLGAIMFFGFLAIVVVLQAIPGLILLYSLLKGLFTPLPLKSTATDNQTDKAH